MLRLLARLAPVGALALTLVSGALSSSALLAQERRDPRPPRSENRERPTWSPHAPRPDAASGRRGGKKDGEEKEPKRGIPVVDELIVERCASCHTQDDRGMMGRISYMRKSPEGWSTSIKRMIRLYGVQVTPDDAREMVRYLATDHGLTRSEAERSLYESERRVHWSEAHHDDDLKRACAQCHTLGRVFAQQRDEEEWKLLRATHLAYFPLAARQVGGEPRNEERRRPPAAAASTTNAAPAQGARHNSRGDRGDRVLSQLAKDQPLFSSEWDDWAILRREVPLTGRWTVTGHEVGRGDVFGTVVLRRVDVDEYETHWTLEFSNGDKVERAGRGLLYAGYSWRGRSRENNTWWREVLLLDEHWEHFRGRIFTGEYSEIGLDIELHRQLGRPRAFAVESRAVTAPATAHVVDVRGEGFTAEMQASEFHFGKGLAVTNYEFVAADHVRLTLDVEAEVELGERPLSFGLFRGARPDVAKADASGLLRGPSIVLYDTIDYIRITPQQGLARIGGAKQPKQFERFEALAMHRGKDEKPYTEDDFPVRMVPEAEWELAEFRVRDDDDDVDFVGRLDRETGFFTPAVDGPNPKRKWQANNVGDVYVVASAELTVPVRPELDAKSAAAKKGAGENGTGEGATSSGETGVRKAAGVTEASGPRAESAEGGAAKPPVAFETRKFRARAHLVVTVPLYARFEVLDWKDE